METLKRTTFWASYLFVVLFFLVAVVTSAKAEDITFSWEAGSGGGPIEGYYVNLGVASGVYDTQLDAGDTTNYKVDVPTNQTTYVAISAYNHRFEGGPIQQSGYSNELVIAAAPANPTNASAGSPE